MSKTTVRHQPGEIVIGYLPGLVGRVAELHAIYYVRQWNFTAYFETRVAKEMSEFINRYDPDRDCTWSLLLDDQIQASITIDGIDAGEQGAHLRWFIASETVRGQGIGVRLMDLAMAFCRDKAYSKIYLHTFSGLEAARHLYQRAGFKLTESRPGDQWGSPVEEQCYEALI